MRSTFLIFKKEIARFINGKVSAVLAVVLPGVLIFSMWTIMGNIINKPKDDGEPVKLAVVNLPESVRLAANPRQIALITLDSLPSRDDMHKRIQEGDYDALVVFPNDFDDQISSFRLSETTGGVPQVNVFYNSDDSKSLKAFEATKTFLDAFESSMVNCFDVNAGEDSYDLATPHDKTGFMSVSLIPFMLLILVFSSCMSVTTEAISGEKERGTLATLLATPIKRRHIAWGKSLACSLIGLTIAISSAIGIFASFPTIMQRSANFGVYGSAEYGLTALVVLSLTVLIVVMIMIISAFAKTTKEAQTYLAPAMVLVMGIGLLGMAGGEPQQALGYYLIPLYNGVEAMICILSFEFNIATLITCIISNFVYAVAGIFVLERLFESERLMFAR